MLITVRLITYFPGLFIVKEGFTELVSVPLAKFQLDKYPQLFSTCCKSQMYFAATQSVSELDVFVVFTLRGIQPLDESKENEGMGGGTTQTFLVSVSGPQTFSIIIDIKNSPG